MEVLVVGNTAYVDDGFCAKAFPGDHVKVVAAAEARRDESSPHASWNELLQHLEQAYEFDRVVYLSNFLTPHTDTVGDIELLRSVFRARALPLHCLRRAGGSVFCAAVRRVLNRIGRFAGLGGCGVSAAVCRGARGAGAPHL